MKAFVVALLLMASGAALAQQNFDPRVAELEARIRSLEQQVLRLTAALEAANAARPLAAPPPVSQPAPATAVETPPAGQAPAREPAVVVTTPPQQDIERAIRDDCFRRQTYEIAIGGAGNFGAC